MKVTVKPHAVGTHRVESFPTFHDWALPLRIVFATAWLPTEHSTLEVDHRWDTRRYLVLHVLFMRLEVVVSGPLWPDDEDDE